MTVTIDPERADSVDAIALITELDDPHKASINRPDLTKKQALDKIANNLAYNFANETNQRKADRTYRGVQRLAPGHCPG
jgi:hypothetical protein